MIALNLGLSFIENRKYAVAEKLWVYWGGAQCFTSLGRNQK